MMAEPVHLFVYGTLRPEAAGPVQARLMRGLRRVGRASIAGRLHDTGAYPAAVPSDQAAERITGELFAMDAGAADGVLGALDAYEGIDAAHPALSLFRRHRVRAEREDGMCVDAWAYFYNRTADLLPRIPSGDWLRRKG